MSEPMDALACARAVQPHISAFGTRFMLDPSFHEPAIPQGFGMFDFYFRGRGAVLGDVDADVVTSVFGFMHGELVRSLWETGRGLAGPVESAELWVEAIGVWANDNLADDLAWEELAALAALVVDATSTAGIPLLAGWRRHPVPDDPRHAAVHLLNLLREHRGGSHLLAVLAHGLTPLDALMASAGPTVASFFGFPQPLPEPTDDSRRAREAAEVTTDALAAAPYEVLSAKERERFAAIVAQVHPLDGP